MIKEVSDYYGVTANIFLYGFSGGAQFAHRFAMLYPEKVKGLSVATPGLVTLPDETKSWWVGIGNVENLFGKNIEWEKMKNIPVQMLIGELDIDPREITVTKDEQCWMEGANDAGKNRKDPLNKLRKELEAKGVGVAWGMVPNVEHDDEQLWPLAAKFFEEISRK